jgi:hypothetical protein
MHTSKFQDLSSQILQDGRGIYSGFCADADVVLCALFKISMNTAHRELPTQRKGWGMSQQRGTQFQPIGIPEVQPFDFLFGLSVVGFVPLRLALHPTLISRRILLQVPYWFMRERESG